ncbi:hypothetical protein [Hydrocarboniphaga sp.]|uniref:hypothetical protein n=1 Tax=Hydrocarboniphaga sp. TaxID=2033016 RepID=UPI003D0FB5CE
MIIMTRPLGRYLLIALFGVAAHASAATLYSFEQLQATSQPQPPPAAIRTALAESEAAKLRDCQQQLGASDEQMASYFTAVKVDLGGATPPALLVLPTKYCYAFIGARAISFWLFLNAPAQPPKLVMSGRREALQVLDSSSHGLPDLAVFYGSKSIQYQYDGERYTSTSE